MHNLSENLERPVDWTAGCKKITPRKAVEVLRHHDTIKELESSCKRGCHLCLHLWNAICTDRTLYDLEILERTTSIHEEQHLVVLVVLEIVVNTVQILLVSGRVQDEQFLNPGNLNDYLSKKKTSRVYKDHKSTVTRAKERRAIKSEARYCLSNASDETFGLARKWLEACLSEHIHCDQARTGPVALPTRLIDASILNGQLFLRLTYPAKSEKVVYVTLSHCWGGAGVFNLTKGTHDSMLQEISMVLLPRSFQDAIFATIKLGYRYLWIDALCIIQDCALDWEKEAATMGDIYRGSICTISADTASDSLQGIFAKNHPLIEEDCRLFEIEDEVFSIRGDIDLHRPSALSKRAWIL
jgi:hypothetical protein